jgi:nucleotide-binding universal stress UspA family protein
MILVPYDFSPKATKALDQAIYIADVSGMPIEIIHVNNKAAEREYPRTWNYKKFDRQFIENKLRHLYDQRLMKIYPANKIKCSFHIVESVLISGAIIKRALANRTKLIIMGTHGFSGAKEVLLGSNTSALINQAIIPVLAIPMNWTPKPILNLIVAVESEHYVKRQKMIEKWAKLLKCSTEWLEFYYLPDKAKIKRIVELYPELKLVKANLSNTLAENLVAYTSVKKKNHALVMFVHQRNLLQKIFNSSITETVSGLIKIPLLALPVKS